MSRLHYRIANNLGRLHNDLMSAIPTLRPKQGTDGRLVATITLEGNDTDVWLTIPDDVIVDAASVQAVITAHNSAPDLVPDVPDFGTDVPDNFVFQIAAGVVQARQYLQIASPSLPQTAAMVKLIIRLILYMLKRNGVV